MKNVYLSVIVLFCILFPSCLYGAVIKKEFYSIDVPEGWVVVNKIEDNVMIISPMEQGIGASIAINTSKLMNQEELDVVSLVANSVKSEGLDVGEAIQTREGYYILPILTRPGGYVFVGSKDNFFDYFMIFGFHPELKNVLQSVRVLKERPYLLSMSIFALSIVNKAMRTN
jgi:hypothetical protein